MIELPDPFYGYRMDLEDHQKLAMMSIDSLGFGDNDFDPPEEIDPRPWHRIENQQSMGSCQGHELSSVGEMCYHIATGEVIQFSPLFAYYATQKIDGLAGADNGSTIGGGAQVATDIGMCPLELMPYPNPVRYKWELPDKCVEAASKFKLRYKIQLFSERDVFKFLASGQGGIGVGIQWSSSMTPNSSGLVESYSAKGGGHAVPLLGYSKRRSTDGRPYYWLANSWSTTWGIMGWAEVAPSVIDSWFRSSRYTVVYGMSDMAVPKPRKIDYAAW